jgi:spermidine synthase
MNPNILVFEPVSRTVSLALSLKKVLLDVKTKYQHVQIVEIEEFGRALILDGLIQCTEADEYLYHESLVHPVMITHPKPKKVLIVGGGDGAALREVLKHDVVEEVILVDIDGELVDIARKYLEVIHKGSFNDPRSRVVIMDGFKYIEESNDRYDVVILDLTDPHGPEIAKALYSKEFYSKLMSRLYGDSIIVTQSGNSFFFPNTYGRTVSNVRQVFSIVREYSVWVPSFGYACNFIIASNSYDPARLSRYEVDERLRVRNVSTSYYNGEVHEMFMRMPVVYNRFSVDVDR